MSILALAQKLLQISGGENPIVFEPLPVDDPKVRQPDITLAKKKLGWEPQVELEVGLKRTLDWMKETLRAP